MFLLILAAGPIAARAEASHSAAPDSTKQPAHDMGAMGHDMADMDMAGMDMSGQDAMTGMYGPYPMTREASGTAWQPEQAAHEGIHVMRGPWMGMLHGSADLVRTQQGGARGGHKLFSGNMLMGMAQRPAGPGTLGLRVMLSGEPATIGKSGYPLLLQTGETADGRTPLVDRQHPHDLFMELAASYSASGGNRSWFVYGGLPGEPALGPPAFMHRFSGQAFPEAPITHHWLDSTHITYGVLTAGAVADRLKLEVSAFRGREPDQERWNLERPKLDSGSLRVSFNPTPAWALQASAGRLRSPEQLEPEVNTDRTTISTMYAHPWEGGRWEAMLAWGRNHDRPGHDLDAFTAETAARVDRHTVFGRWERVQKDELLPPGDTEAGRAFPVTKVAAGYRYDLWRIEHLTAGIGAMGSVVWLPFGLSRAYGSLGTPTSGLLFARVALR